MLQMGLSSISTGRGGAGRLRARARALATWAIAALLMGACGEDMPYDPMDPRLDDARLVIVGSAAVNLRHGAESELRVRYVSAEGDVISNAPIDYEIVGDAAGSRLSALQTTTDGDGEAGVSLTAGSADATFVVHVSPPRGDAVDFNVAVSQDDVGSIVVTMTYAGSRELVRFDTFLFEGEDCATMNPNALPTAIRSAPSASDVMATPAFAGVRVGSDYTVAVVARTEAAIGAFGCRDGVAVTAGAETPVNITLMDVQIGPSFVGVWDLDNRLDFGGALPPSVQAFVDAMDELTDDSSLDGERVTDEDGDGVFPEYGADPGAFVVDLAMRQTCAWECMTGENYDTCSSLNHGFGDLTHVYLNNGWFTGSASDDYKAQSRFSGGCFGWTVIHKEIQQQVNTVVAENVPDFVTHWANLIGDVARAITRAHILSVLTINQPMAGDEFALPMSHELVQMVVTVRDPTTEPAGMSRDFTFSLAEAGFTSLSVEETTTVDGTTLNIPSHTFMMNWGELVLYIYRNVVLDEIFGVTSTGDLLATWVDCASLGARLVEGVCDCDASVPAGMPNSCDGCIISPSQAENYCGLGLQAAGAAIEGVLAGFLDSEGTFTLQGSAMGADIDESTGQVDTLTDGVWSGSWGEGAMSEDLEGTFTGTRRSTM